MYTYTHMGRIVVLGLDAFHEDLFEYTPYLENLRQESVCGQLESTRPPVTAPAWATFQTGRFQGNHGIFDFVRYDEDFNLEFLDGSNLRTPAFYEYLAKEDFECLLFNLPFSLPARIEGDIIPSWLDPEDRDPVPSDLYEKYGIEPPDYPTLAGSRTDRVQQIRESFEHNCEQFSSILEADDHDFYFQLVSATDWFQHNAYLALESGEESDLGQEARDLLNRVDKYVASIDAALGEEDDLIIVSDHGFRRYEGQFHINDWLAREGYLVRGETKLSSKETTDNTTVGLGSVGRVLAGQEWLYPILRPLKGWASKTLGIQVEYESGIDMKSSDAYCLSKDECAIHVSDNVESERREELISEMVAKLDDEDGVSATKASDVYEGPYASEAGDVLVESQNLRVQRGPVGRVATSEPVAYHSSHGIVMFASDQSSGTVQGANLVDLAPTILAVAGVPVPDDMEGSPIDEATTRPVEFTDSVKGQVGVAATDRDGDQTVEDRLRGLGYL